MSRRVDTALLVMVSISIFVLLWITSQPMREVVPIWLVVDALVSQLVLITALSRAVTLRVELGRTDP